MITIQVILWHVDQALGENIQHINGLDNSRLWNKMMKVLICEACIFVRSTTNIINKKKTYGHCHG